MEYNILSFGAVPDGKTLNTAAIQQAVDRCAAAGGGTVIVPPGKFITGTVFLKSRVHLHLAPGAVLQGSSDINDYCPDDAYPQNARQNPEGWRGAHVIAAVEAEDVSLSGPGVIDGNCEAFFTAPGAPSTREWGGGLGWARGIRGNDPAKSAVRPGQMAVFVECRRVRVENVTLRNSPCWSLLLHGTSQAVIKGVIIDNPVDGVNTDGIDIDCSSQVTVSDCIITTGDDAITLRASGRRLKKQPHVCEDVTISNCVLDSSVCAFRIGVGSGLIRNAMIGNIVIKHAGTAFFLQSSYGKKPGGTTIENISVSGVRGRQVGYPVKIVAGPQGPGGAKIRNISFNDFHTECCGGISIGSPETVRPENIVFYNCSFDVVKRPHFCREDKRPSVFFDIQQGDRIRFSECALNWVDPDPEWRQVENLSNVTAQEKVNCRFQELKSVTAEGN